ncbi:hypothetical protein [Inhella sp.]|uniref:hypothetical protein n=1 Tax=Inhella sp. TaxID=1921806 RepID=UPI0035ADC298
MKSTLTALALTTALGFTHAAPTIDTTGASFGTVSPFGESNTATYGQTFLVTGAETRLQGFQLRLNDNLNSDFVDFAAYVYAWDGAKATGPQLWASGAQSSSNNGGADGMELFSFSTGGVDLVAGQQYVAFLSASNFFDGVNGTAFMELSNSDAYAGGNFVYFNNGNNFGALTASTWDCAGSCIGGRDLWFKADFSAPNNQVPLPASLYLVGIGLLTSGALRRKAR